MCESISVVCVYTFVKEFLSPSMTACHLASNVSVWFPITGPSQGSIRHGLKVHQREREKRERDGETEGESERRRRKGEREREQEMEMRFREGEKAGDWVCVFVCVCVCVLGLTVCLLGSGSGSNACRFMEDDVSQHITMPAEMRVVWLQCCFFEPPK